MSHRGGKRYGGERGHLAVSKLGQRKKRRQASGESEQATVPPEVEV